MGEMKVYTRCNEVHYYVVYYFGIFRIYVS